MVFPAHIRITEKGEKIIQSVQEHLESTAMIAENDIASAGLGKTGYLAGLLHDMGKMQKGFADYIETVTEGGNARRGEVIHTFAGAKYLLQRYHPGALSRAEDYVPELLAIAIGSHHSLFDAVDERHRSGLDHRQESLDPGTLEAIENFAHEFDQNIIDNLVKLATDEFMNVMRDTGKLSGVEECDFYLAMIARLITSAVIDGDRCDTAAFMSGKTVSFARDMATEDWNFRLKKLEAYLKDLTNDTPIGKARQVINDTCLKKAEMAPGLFSFSAPTGAGKTLASMRFAIAHAMKWHKKRVIYTAPLLTIIDQTADIYRKALGDDGFVLEHHSNLAHSENNESSGRADALIQSWDAPLIVTTLVQLLDTLFAGSMACVRRFQALCDSVIIIDEVQTVPIKMLALFAEAVNFLTEKMGATVVLCSATQPSLDKAEVPLHATARELMPDDPHIRKAFERTEMIYAGGMLLEDMPPFIAEKLDENGSLLVICNKKAEAEYLYHTIEVYGIRKFYLSASMCPSHRRKVLEEIRTALREDEAVLCISTQVVEAGVDFSFRSVIRLMAGMDNAVQAAGRCNRNGEMETAPVYILQCDAEKLSYLREIEQAKTACMELVTEYETEPEAFDNDLTGKKAIDRFYSALYGGMNKGFQKFGLSGEDKRETIYGLLTENSDYADPDFSKIFEKYGMRQAFRKAGDAFKVYDDDTTDVIVPYGRGNGYVDTLLSMQAKYDYDLVRRTLDQARECSVALYGWQLAELERKGLLITMNVWGTKVYALSSGVYDEETGFSTKQSDNSFLEV